MKVLMITPSYEPIIGGTETVVKNLTTHLNKNGITTDIMTFNMNKRWKPIWKWEKEIKDHYTIYKIPAYNIFSEKPNPGFILKLSVFPHPGFIKILEKYDIIHFHDDIDLTFPFFSYFVKKPKVFHVHTLQETYDDYNILSRNMLKQIADIYIVASKSNENLMKKLKVKNIRLLANGVDIDKFKFNSKNRIEKNILFVGRFEKRKGLHVLIDSLKYLSQKVHLIIIGPHYNDEYAAEILRRINEINNETEHFIEYLGSINHEKLVEYLQKTSMMVCPSLSEDFGMVVIEAMSCGTPVIASCTGGLIDIITDGDTGILFQTSNSNELAQKIEYLNENKDIRGKIGKNGREKVEKNFSWYIIVQKLLKIYKTL